MNLDKHLIASDDYAQLSSLIFRILDCNLLWIFHINGNALTMSATDKPVLEHYWSKQYYLDDPSIVNNVDEVDCDWTIKLGADSNALNKNGFIHDLHELFELEEFVSIEKQVASKRYCFRFFTYNNRFVFMSALLNNMPLVKYFMNSTIGKLGLEKAEQHQKSLDLTSVKRGSHDAN